MLLLSAWLMLGTALVIRANSLGLVGDISFSPWHAPGYAALAVLAGFVLLSVNRAVAAGRGWRRAFPDRYSGVPLGAAVLVSWIALDVLWRLFVGIRPGIEGALAPPRLLLPIGIALVASGPLLDALDARGESGSPGNIAPRLAGAASLALIVSLAALLPFHPAASALSERASDPVSDDSEIWLMSANGSHQTRLLPAPGDGVDYSLPAWSPDGKRLAFTEWRNVGGADSNIAPDEQTASIWTVGVEGGNPTLVVETDATWNWIPAWSPDGAWILYTSKPLQPTDTSLGAARPAPQPNAPPAGPLAPPATIAPAQLWLVRPDGTERHQLMADQPADRVAGAWSPDGRSIAYVSIHDGNQDIYKADLVDGKIANEVRLTDDPGEDWSPAWSPDGTRVVFNSNRNGNFDIWVVNRDGSGLAQLTDDSANDWAPGFSPDGTRLVFTSDRGGDTEVWSVGEDGGDARNLSNSPSRSDGQWSAAWSPSGQQIAYATAAYPPVYSTPVVREDLAAAGMLLHALMLALVAIVLVRLRAPLGSFALVLGVSVFFAALISNEWRFLPGAILLGLAVDTLVAKAPPRLALPLAASAFPVALVLTVGITLAATGVLGWTLTLLSGVALIAAMFGWAFAETVSYLSPGAGSRR